MDSINIQFQEYAATDFGLMDFNDEANLDEFIDLLRGDDIIDNEADAPNIVGFSSDRQVFDFDHCHDMIGVGCLEDNGQLFSSPDQLFGCDVGTNDHQIPSISPSPDGISALNGFLNDLEENDDDDDDDNIMDGDESSGTTTSRPTNKKGGHKADRWRTLISERKRRGRMKEKLYALRALVPNITKMDKASIVGDAVLYIQDLQMQAKKLKTEIASLESTLPGGKKSNQSAIRNAKNMNVTNFYPIIKKISKMDVYQVDDGGFYVRIISHNGKGVAALLYKALESLKSFNLESSNLAASAENYVLTFTLHIKELEVDLSLPDLKLWIMSAFLNQGFYFQAQNLDSNCQ